MGGLSGRGEKESRANACPVRGCAYHSARWNGEVVVEVSPGETCTRDKGCWCSRCSVSTARTSATAAFALHFEVSVVAGDAIFYAQNGNVFSSGCRDRGGCRCLSCGDTGGEVSHETNGRVSQNEADTSGLVDVARAGYKSCCFVENLGPPRSTSAIRLGSANEPRTTSMKT